MIKGAAERKDGNICSHTTLHRYYLKTSSSVVAMGFYGRYKHEKRDVRIMITDKGSKRTLSHNLNSYSNFMELHDFRFKVTYIPKISNSIFLQNGVTTWPRYSCDSLMSCF